jgi:hypothetical protein
MKKTALIAAIAMMALTSLLSGINIDKPLFPIQEKNVDQLQKSKCKKHRHCRPCKKCPAGANGINGANGATGPTGTTGPLGPLGSFYSDSSSQTPLQTIVTAEGAPVTAPVFFSGTNVNNGVSLSLAGNNIVVPVDGNYSIDWNAVVSLLGNSGFILFDLQKNGATLLNPSPQAEIQLVHSPVTAAASVIVPLLANDEISLLLTIDGFEGGSGVQIDSAQISATWHSP